MFGLPHGATGDPLPSKFGLIEYVGQVRHWFNKKNQKGSFIIRIDILGKEFNLDQIDQSEYFEVVLWDA